MNSSEKTIQVLDITATIVIFVLSCANGKVCLNHYDTWLSFNGPALGIIAVGELVWWRVRKKIIQKCEDRANGPNKRTPNSKS